MRLYCVAIFAIAVLLASVNARPKSNRRLHRSPTHERRTRSLEHYRDIQEPLESASDYEDEKARLLAAEIEKYERNRIHKKHMDYEHDTNAINQEYVPTYDQGYHHRRANGVYENPKDNDFNDPIQSGDQFDDSIPGVVPRDGVKNIDEVEENFAVDLDDGYQQEGGKHRFQYHDFDRNDIDSADDDDHSFDHPSYYDDYDTHVDEEYDEGYDDEFEADQFENDDQSDEEFEEESDEDDVDQESSEEDDEQDEMKQDEDQDQDDDDQQMDEEESQFGNDSPRQDNDQEEDDDSQKGFDGTDVLNPRGNDGSTLSQQQSNYHKPSLLTRNRFIRRLEALK